MYNTLKLTHDQLVDEIYYSQPFIDARQQSFFQSLQLMCNEQYSCVDLIELLCTINRTLDGILNLFQSTITPTHDAMLYYNEKWNISSQCEFLGYSFTRTNTIKFDIPLGYSMDKLRV